MPHLTSASIGTTCRIIAIAYVAALIFVSPSAMSAVASDLDHPVNVDAMRESGKVAATSAYCSISRTRPMFEGVEAPVVFTSKGARTELYCYTCFDWR